MILLMCGRQLPGQGLSFTELSSSFNELYTNSQPGELGDLIKKMEGAVETPWERAKMDYYRGFYFYRLSEFSNSTDRYLKASHAFEALGDTLESMKCQLQLIFNYRISGQVEEARKIGDDLIQRGKNYEESPLLRKAYRARAILYRDQGKMDSARKYQAVVRDMALADNDTREYASAIIELATIYKFQDQHKKALEEIEKLRPLIGEVNDYRLEIHFYNLVGMIHGSLDQIPESLENLEKSLQLARKYKAVRSQALIHNNLGNAYNLQGDTARAIKEFEAGIEINLELNNINSLCVSSLSLAGLLIEQGRYIEANSYAGNALHYSELLSSDRLKCHALKIWGECKYYQGEMDAAILDLTQADSLATVMHDWAWIHTINELLAKCMEEKGAFKKALEYQRRSAVANDSVEYLESKKYADSLLISQKRLAPQEKAVEAKEGAAFSPWWLIGPGLLLLLLVVAWRMMRGSASKPQKEPEVDPKQLQEAVEGLKKHKDWGHFMLQFDAIYPGLTQRIAQKHPDLTPTDLRMLVLSRLGLSLDEIAGFMSISLESAKKARYRTRKRLGLPSQESLMQYMLKM